MKRFLPIFILVIISPFYLQGQKMDTLTFKIGTINDRGLREFENNITLPPYVLNRKEITYTFGVHLHDLIYIPNLDNIEDSLFFTIIKKPKSKDVYLQEKNNDATQSKIVVFTKDTCLFLSNVKFKNGLNLTVPIRFSLSKMKADGTVAIFYSMKLGVLINDILEGKIFQAQVLQGTYVPNFLYEDYFTKVKNRLFRQFEPFYFNGHFRKIGEIDFMTNTVQIETLPDSNRVYGYNYGYYLEEKIMKKINKIIPSKDFTVIHFWGPWCQPCMVNMDEKLAYAKKLDESKNINFLSACILWQDKNDNLNESVQLDSLRKQKTFKYEFVEYFNKKLEHPDGYRIVKLLYIELFPNYIIIDKYGKILARDFQDLNQVEKFLNKLL